MCVLQDGKTERKDIIKFDNTLHSVELFKDLKVDEAVDVITKNTIIDTVQNYWNCFIKKGAKRTILGYEFGINTSGAKLVCCRKPSYGLYESKI